MTKMTGPLSSDQIEQFHQDGYLIIRQLFSPEETDLLLQTARGDRVMLDNAFDVADTSGRQSKLSLWNHPGDDLWGMVSRCERIVGAMEQLLDGEVYHYHSKMMLKEPRVGGAWEWHQDYGYWYQNGCLFPDMASCLIALDPATKANGCIQMLKGSHKLGRVEHGRFGGQTGADPERVEQAMKRMELAYCEMNPGDAVHFHSNTLHRSDENRSDTSRWSLICCYNAARNDPYKESHHPRYTPLKKVPDSAVLETGARTTSPASASFMAPESDRTTQGVRANNG